MEIGVKQRWYARLWNWICRKNDELYEKIIDVKSETQ